MIKDLITKTDAEKLISLINDSDTIICTCHISPDGDAIGSCLGWAEYMKTVMGKEVQIIVPDQYPDYLQWMPNTETIIRYDKHQQGCNWTLEHADLIFCLDYNTLSRIDQMEPALRKTSAKLVMIDHHPNPDVETVLTISHPEASSTCELVFRLVWQLGGFEQLTKKFASTIFCGMMTDTGGFTYNSNDSEIFFIISQLLSKGINKDKIYRNVYHNFSEDRLRLMGFVMYEKLVVNAQKHASYYTLTREDLQRFHFIKGDAEGLVNMPLQIKGMKMSISLREDTEKENMVWVSLRSVDQFPCNKVAERFFNGGGHLNAAGGRLQMSMAEAEKVAQQAIQAIDEFEP